MTAEQAADAPAASHNLRLALYAFQGTRWEPAEAVLAVWEAVRDPALGLASRWAFLADVDRALGFGLAGAVAPDADESGSDPRIDVLVAERQAARAAKDFAASDRIRDELAAEGIDLVDTADGPSWRRR